MSLLNELGGSRTQVSRPVHPEPGAPQGRPAHGHHKTQAVKKRLAEVAPCAGLQIGLLNPTADLQRWAETIPRFWQAQANEIFSEVSLE